MKQRKQWISLVCILAILFAVVPIPEGNPVSHAAGTLSSGLYYIKNNYSNKYLCPEFDSVDNGARVWQRTQTSPPWAMVLWKVTDVGNGYYTIRPYAKSDRGLYFPGEAMDVTLPCIGETTPSDANAKWLIQSTSGGYVIRADSSSYNYLTLYSDTTSEGAIITTRPEQGLSRQRWTFVATSPSDCILFYQRSTSQVVSNPTVYLQPDHLSTPGEIGFVPIVCSYSSNCPDVTYSSTSSGVLPHPNGSIYGYAGSTATITVRSAAVSSISASFSAIVLPIADGTYVFKNRKTGRYVDIKNQTMSNGTQIHQWDFHGDDSQRWIVRHIGNGYYSIRSANSTSNYYLGVSGDSTANDTPIVLRSGSLTNGMKWKFVSRPGGSYKIIPKTGEANNRVLAVGWYAANVNGIDIEQRDFVDDTNYKDEWYIEESTSLTVVTLCGIDNSGHDHSSALNDCRNQLISIGYNNIRYHTGSISGEYCKLQLAQSNIFTIRSHGGVSVFPNGTVAATVIILNDDGNGDGLYSHACLNMTEMSSFITAADSFSQMKMALFIGCTTAFGGNGARNLPTALVAQGANVAVGFSDSINCASANDWTRDFYSHLMEGYTVQASVEYASLRQTANSGLRSAVICGNGNYKLGN